MEKELANGVTVSCHDESRKLAADRWLVRLRCRAAIPLQGWMWESLQGDDPQTVFCREQLDGQLLHEIVMERNFIDAGDKDQVLAELVEQLEGTVVGYLGKEAFVRQLFTIKLAEVTQLYAQQGWTERVEEDDLPGPADFSACFH